MKPRPNGHNNGSDPRGVSEFAGIAPRQPAPRMPDAPLRLQRVRQGRAYTRRPLLAVVVALLAGCSLVGVEVGSGELHSDRFQARRGKFWGRRERAERDQAGSVKEASSAGNSPLPSQQISGWS